MNRFRLDLAYTPVPAGEPARLRLDAENLHPAARTFALGARSVTLVGNPIVDAHRDDARVLKWLEACGGDWQRFARGLNGSFLVIVDDAPQRRLVVINDRFASLALYWLWQAGRFVASTSFMGLAAREPAFAGRPDAEEVFTFIAMRRLYAETTFLGGVSFLRSASILSADTSGVAVESYWTPRFDAAPPRERALPLLIAERLRAAVSMHMSDERRFGLLLSGGLDSRALLAAAPRPPACFTTCLRENNESAVAAEVARLAGAEFHFIPRRADLYDRVLDDACFIGGMQVYNEAQFMGYGPAVAGHADTLMIGLGLDVFFGGLYLPKRPVRILSREGFHHRLKPLPKDLTGFYLGNVKYRLKTSDPYSIVRPEAKERLHGAVRARIDGVLSRGRELGASGYALWEYMHLHNFSRHYSFPMMASVRTFVDCRAPALENEMLDLTLAMTPESRLDGTAYQDAISLLAPAMMRVRNANTNLPAAWSLRRQTLAKIANRAASLFGAKPVRSPDWRDRSWPLPRASLEACPTLLMRAAGLERSSVLESLGIFDMRRIGTVLADHRDGRHDHTVLINLLLTADSVLGATGGG